MMSIEQKKRQSSIFKKYIRENSFFTCTNNDHETPKQHSKTLYHIISYHDAQNNRMVV